MDKYETWYKMSLELKRIKAEEAALRRELCEELFDGKVGEFRVKEEFDDYIVTAESKVTRKLDSPQLDSIWDQLSPAEQGAIIHKPSLVLRNYRKLPDHCLLHSCITESPAMPTLKLEVK